MRAVDLMRQAKGLYKDCAGSSNSNDPLRPFAHVLPDYHPAAIGPCVI